MKNIKTIFFVLLLAFGSCTKDYWQFEAPNGRNRVFRVANTSGYDLTLIVGNHNFNVGDKECILIPDSLWAWQLTDDGTIQRNVDSITICLDSTLCIVHKCLESSFSPSVNNLLDMQSYWLYYDEKIEGYVYQCAISYYDLNK